MEYVVNQFLSGTHNLLDDENIPNDAASDSKNFVTKDGQVVLAYGRSLIGAEGAVGKVYGLHFGYKTDGTKVFYRKIGTKIQYLNGTTWTDIITGLTETAEYTFANYSSLSGAFTFINGVDGYWKVINANPGSPIQMYDAAKNFHGKIIIDKGRTFLWDRSDPYTQDPTGLYLSHIDRQDNTTQSSIIDEVLGASGASHYTGTVKAKTSLTATITIATPGVVTATSHGFQLGSIVKFSTTGALPTGLLPNTSYYVISAGLTANDFQLSAIPQGTTGWAAINTTGSQSGTHTIPANTRNIFGVKITGTTGAGVETFTDNFSGVLTSDKGGTGTINYSTGAIDITFNAAVSSGNVLVTYFYEDSNVKGLTDFTYTIGARAAGQGAVFRQDQGGDKIMSVAIGQDGAYYSIKQQSSYRLWLDPLDGSSTTQPTTNEVFYLNLGLPNFRSVISTSKGIIFMNIANPEKPELTILQRNPLGDRLEPYSLFNHFKFADYDYSDCSVDTYERFIIVSCKSQGAVNNDTILLCNITNDPAQRAVDITSYPARMFAKDGINLYSGSPITMSVHQLYNGFDDAGYPVDNFWIGKGEQYSRIEEKLKKFKHLRLKGLISADQNIEVYISYDDNGFTLVSTLSGKASYVDYSSPQTIGSNMVGESPIGGDISDGAYPYFAEIKLTGVPKFRKRMIKLIAKGIGYFDLDTIMDDDILLFEGKIPKRFRQKQNVSLDGLQTNQ